MTWTRRGHSRIVVYELVRTVFRRFVVFLRNVAELDVLSPVFGKMELPDIPYQAHLSLIKHSVFRLL